MRVTRVEKQSRTTIVKKNLEKSNKVSPEKKRKKTRSEQVSVHLWRHLEVGSLGFPGTVTTTTDWPGASDCGLEVKYIGEIYKILLGKKPTELLHPAIPCRTMHPSARNRGPGTAVNCQTGGSYLPRPRCHWNHKPDRV